MSNMAKVIQFPLSLCFAATSHRFQGQTVYKPNKTVNDFRTVFQAAQGYVMLSRVETLDQLFILGELPDSKFYANNHALEELARLERVSVNRNPPVWQKDFPWSIKISQLNCRSLCLHIYDIKQDPILAFSDVICLNETWMKDNYVEEKLEIDGLNLHLNSNGAGKGIATYIRDEKMHIRQHITKEKAQISKFSAPEMDLINIYRSEGMDNSVLAGELENIIDTSRFTVICGDFNLCYIEQRNNVITKMLESNGFDQLVYEATHLKGGHIDHVYSNHDPKQFNVELGLYSPFYLASDHDAICITITKPAKRVPSMFRKNKPSNKGKKFEKN